MSDWACFWWIYGCVLSPLPVSQHSKRHKTASKRAWYTDLVHKQNWSEVPLLWNFLWQSSTVERSGVAYFFFLIHSYIDSNTTLAKKIVTAEKFMRLMRQSDHVILCDIELRFDIDATHGICVSRVALQIEVDAAWYHMIALRINLMPRQRPSPCLVSYSNPCITSVYASHLLNDATMADLRHTVSSRFEERVAEKTSSLQSLRTCQPKLKNIDLF